MAAADERNELIGGKQLDAKAKAQAMASLEATADTPPVLGAHIAWAEHEEQSA